MPEVIVAVFQTVQIADAAEAALHGAGVLPENIGRFRPDEAGMPTTSASGHAGTGFWSWLRTHPDHAGYEEHVTAGRTVMSVHADSPPQANAVVALLSGYAPRHLEAKDDAPRDARLRDRDIPPAGLDAGSPLPGVSDAEQPRNTASTEAEPIPGLNDAVRAHTTGVPPSEPTQSQAGQPGQPPLRRYVVEQPVQQTIPTIHNSGFAR